MHTHFQKTSLLNESNVGNGERLDGGLDSFGVGLQSLLAVNLAVGVEVHNVRLHLVRLVDFVFRARPRLPSLKPPTPETTFECK